MCSDYQNSKNVLISYFLKWKVCCYWNQILIAFYEIFISDIFTRLLFLDRYGGIHILEVVARKKGCKGQWNYENRPANVKISKENWNIQIRILSLPIFIFSVSIKLTPIYITETCTNELINSKVILTHFKKKKISQILFGGWNRQTKKGYTSSGEPGMERSLLRY